MIVVNSHSLPQQLRRCVAPFLIQTLSKVSDKYFFILYGIVGPTNLIMFFFASGHSISNRVQTSGDLRSILNFWQVAPIITSLLNCPGINSVLVLKINLT